MDNYSIGIPVNGTTYKVHVYQEAVVAWAIHTSKNRKNITVERIAPLTVEIGATGNHIPRWNAQPDQEAPEFIAQFEDSGMAGSVRFIQPEPGTRFVTAYVEAVGSFDLGVELPGTEFSIPTDCLKARVVEFVECSKRKVVNK